MEASMSEATTAPKVKKGVGLAGVTAGNTALCTVGHTGNDLHYRGYDILDVAEKCEFEEIAFLLVYGILPTQVRLDCQSAWKFGSSAASVQLVAALGARGHIAWTPWSSCCPVSKRLPPLVPADLVVEQVLPTPDCLTILCRSCITAPACPGCGHPSSRRHSSYPRRLADLPW